MGGRKSFLLKFVWTTYLIRFIDLVICITLNLRLKWDHGIFCRLLVNQWQWLEFRESIDWRFNRSCWPSRKARATSLGWPHRLSVCSPSNCMESMMMGFPTFKLFFVATRARDCTICTYKYLRSRLPHANWRNAWESHFSISRFTQSFHSDSKSFRLRIHQLILHW